MFILEYIFYETFNFFNLFKKEGFDYDDVVITSSLTISAHIAFYILIFIFLIYPQSGLSKLQFVGIFSLIAILLFIYFSLYNKADNIVEKYNNKEPNQLKMIGGISVAMFYVLCWVQILFKII
jgi:threonine/homoserine/homoserine lactone efflux protein